MKGQTGISQVKVSGEGEGSPGRRSSVYESWKWRGVRSWSTDNGTEMRNKAGEVGGHQMTKDLKSHGKPWPLYQG